MQLRCAVKGLGMLSTGWLVSCSLVVSWGCVLRMLDGSTTVMAWGRCDCGIECVQRDKACIRRVTRAVRQAVGA
jgi:hypothetical protein